MRVAVSVAQSVVCAVFSLVCSVAVSQKSASASVPRVGKVEARALRDAQQVGRASVVIVMEDQADVRQAQAMSDDSARGWLVFQTLRDTAERSQGPLCDWLRQHGVSFQRFWAANVVVAELDKAQLLTVAARPDVRHIEANVSQRWIEPDAIADKTLSPYLLTPVAEWGVKSVGAPSVWALGAYGQGIVVANADTGMQWNHPAIRSQYRGYSVTGTVSHDYSWHDSIHGPVMGNPCGSDATAPCDDQGHGTHTMGTVVGDDGLGNQIGVAPAARWIGCRNMERGMGTPARYIECFQFFIAPTDVTGSHPDPDLRPHVVNNSWGCPTEEGCAVNTLKLIVENTQAAGIFVEASAGNAGPACSTVDDGPALFGETFSVGAIDANGKLAGFSSRGPVTVDGSGRMKPDLVAPGVRVRSCLPGNRYGSLSGTSMAGPHVVGVIALLWSARPELSRQIAATKALLLASSVPAVTLGFPELCGGVSSDFVPNNSFGAGRVDALAAITW